jgi:predicted amidohydrolase YtcJ
MENRERRDRSRHDQSLFANHVIRAGAIYSMTSQNEVYRSLALRDGRIVALDKGAHGLDGLISQSTIVVDDPALTVLPGFIDTHTHFIVAAHSVDDVPVGQARDIEEFVGLIHERAASTPRGQWIRTSAAWNESNLAEGRMPLARDLDRATTDHPVLVKRGGHNEVLNSLGMQIAGVTRDTPAPAGGTIDKDEAGNPTGWLIDTAMSFAEKVFPAPAFKSQVDSMGKASLDYAAHGITLVRDAFVTRDEMLLFQAASEAGVLRIRARPMVGLAFAGASAANAIAEINGWGVRSGFGDDMLRLWGLKIVLDGGAENGATEEPYANRPDFKGQLMFEPDTLVQVISHAVKRGWKVGTHAWGDRAVRTILDIYERVLRDEPDLAAGRLVLEHGGLARADQRARTVRMGIPVTVQHPLLYSLAHLLIKNWGEARTAEAFPLREWIDEGAFIAAGSDYPVGSYDAMASVWGMVTRQTKAGVLGPEHAIDAYTAVKLYTREAARLIGEQKTLGTLEAGKHADLVAYRGDPITAQIDEIVSLRPVFTVVGGEAVYDPERVFGSSDISAPKTGQRITPPRF